VPNTWGLEDSGNFWAMLHGGEPPQQIMGRTLFGYPNLNLRNLKTGMIILH